MAYDSTKREKKRKREEKEGSEMLGVAATLTRLNGDQDTSDARENAQRSLQDGDLASAAGAAAGDATAEKRPQGDSGGEWQTVERKNKRQKKENANYPAITQSNSSRLQSFVKISDLQNLVLYLLADGFGPQWISVRHKKEVERVVCLLVPGLEADMFSGKISLDPEQRHAPSQAGNTPSVDGQPRNITKKHDSPDDYYPTKLVPEKLPDCLSPLANIFQHIWPIKTPGDFNRMHSPLYAMLNSPIPRPKEDKKIKGPRPPNVGKDFQSKRTPVTEFLATREELSDNNFALHPVYQQTQQEKDFEAARRHKACRSPEDGWIDLPENMTDIEDGTVPFSDIEAGSITAGRNLLFIDCEMVTTTLDRFALARVSLLSWDGNVVMDELVQPPDPVKDYLTPYSGISKEMLDPVTTTLAQVQDKLKTLLTPRTILAGHSLDSDLKALKISFPFVIDTTLLYPHPKGAPQKSSLKWLTQKYLSREIQNRGPKGHDSVEDARACLDLVKQKCEKGKAWGTSEATGESIFKRIGQHNNDNSKESRTGAVVDWGDPRKGYGASATVSVGCETDADVVAGVRRVVLGSSHPSLSDAEIQRCVSDEVPLRGVDFTWARLRELEALRGWWNRTKSVDAAERLAKTLDQQNNNNDDDGKDEGDNGGDVSPAALSAAVRSTVSRIEDIYAALPPKTAFIVYTGSGDPRALRKFTQMHADFKRAYDTMKWDELPVKWTDVEEQGMREAANKARMGCGFVCCK